eukprot:6730039-Prymnesium_polylepis.1
MLHRFHKHGEPAHVDGSWAFVTKDWPGITQTLPMECVESKRPSPTNGRTDLGELSPNGMCSTHYAPCFGSRSTSAFQARLSGLQYAWRPKKECRFSPLGMVNIAGLTSWAAAIEANAGKMLWVGDSALAQMFMAWEHLTGGAARREPPREQVRASAHAWHTSRARQAHRPHHKRRPWPCP